MKCNVNNKRRKMMPLIAVILWMALIFIFSSQPLGESSKLSSVITNDSIKAIAQDPI